VDSRNRQHLEHLRQRLLSPDEQTRKIAAACIRAGQDVKDTARAANAPVVISRDGQVLELHPDSPILPDYSELLALADRLVPVPAGRSLEMLLHSQG
jgi:hypothetical protein